MVLYPYAYIQLTPRFPLFLVSGLVTKSCPTLETPWTIARQDPLSIRFPRQEYWSGLPLLSPGDLPDPGIEPLLLHWQADSLVLSHQGSLTLCHLMDCSLPGSSVHEIL